jgi:hypothetical protein
LTEPEVGGDDEKLIKNSVDKICGAFQYINMFPAEFKPWFLAEASKGVTGKEILVNFTFQDFPIYRSADCEIIFGVFENSSLFTSVRIIQNSVYFGLF